MSVIIGPNICSNNRIDFYLQQHRCEHLKSRVKLFFLRSVSTRRNSLNCLNIHHIQGTEIIPLGGGHENAKDFQITA